jgi:hypothetical protein
MHLAWTLGSCCCCFSLLLLLLLLCLCQQLVQCAADLLVMFKVTKELTAA